ncbi:class I SAM-dependent methyltransferase [Rhodovulum kholense]|uniref:Methyltransferase family protein n=1 Tax=Rhodovulum kholense TaxID=453584 RepID=A0A8E2VHE8_9RHOB|nr:class I SAM-dependent methyltransferase [Rhodovulum kholense]PTW44288.1 methyltransferase family protein [Rhodovulum kholense]
MSIHTRPIPSRARVGAKPPRGSVSAALAALDRAPSDPAALRAFVATLAKADMERARSARFEAALARALAEPSVCNLTIQSFASAYLAGRFMAAAAKADGKVDVPPGLLNLTIAHLYHRLNVSLALEPFLIALRRDLLEAARDGRAVSARQIALAEALARHSFTCEYIWLEAEAETEALETVQRQVETAIAEGADVPALPLFVLGAYRPLDRFPALRAWVALQAAQGLERLDPTLRLLVFDRLQEEALIPRIETLTAIEDATSAAVQAQYEENPYPRWRHLGRRTPVDFKTYLTRELAIPPALTASAPARTRVLVAGCGTGQHPISLALSLLGGAVLAIDLSRASLAYALREARARGVENLGFAHADILKLDGLEDAFDLIEAMGVLHHMRDPEAGLAVLVKALRPGGFLRLGLYSRPARRAVIAMRSRIATVGYRPDLEGMRAFRRDFFLDRLYAEAPELCSFRDFYATSELRDLIFHVQERDYITSELAEMLDRNGLEFLGFSGLDADVMRRYRDETPDDPTGTDLAAWGRFEDRYPETFRGMYRLSCRKAAPLPARPT